MLILYLVWLWMWLFAKMAHFPYVYEESAFLNEITVCLCLCGCAQEHDENLMTFDYIIINIYATNGLELQRNEKDAYDMVSSIILFVCFCCRCRISLYIIVWLRRPKQFVSFLSRFMYAQHSEYIESNAEMEKKLYVGIIQTHWHTQPSSILLVFCLSFFSLEFLFLVVWILNVHGAARMFSQVVRSAQTHIYRFHRSLASAPIRCFRRNCFIHWC